MLKRQGYLGTLLLSLSFSALADQMDPRLTGLFERLARAPDVEAAFELEQKIWSIWSDTGQNEINRLMRYGVLEMNRGRYDQAVEIFTQVIKRAPEFAEGWNKRATAHYLNQNYSASVLDIGKTLRLEPRHFGAISGMGLIFLKRKDWTGALSAFEQVLEINPHAQGARVYVNGIKKQGAI